MKRRVVGGLGLVVRKLAGGRSQPSKRNRQPATAKMHQPKKVRLFSKPFCSWCGQSMDWLDDHQIQYDTLDVVADEKAYDEMYRLSGQTLAPVIDVDGKILADFGARELAAFWKKLEQHDS